MKAIFVAGRPENNEMRLFLQQQEEALKRRDEILGKLCVELNINGKHSITV